MSHLATGWSRLRAWSASHGPELRLCVRSTTAAVLTLAAAQVLHLPIALWAVLTAVILTQISVGRSLKATIDYLASTLGGAIYAGAIGALVPHDNQFAVFVALAIALAPAVLLAAVLARSSIQLKLTSCPIRDEGLILVRIETCSGQLNYFVDEALAHLGNCRSPGTPLGNCRSPGTPLLSAAALSRSAIKAGVRIHKTSQAFPDRLSLPCGVGFQNFERANALLKNIPQLAVAFWERISHQGRTQRINAEQLELANIPLKIAKALSGDAIAHCPHARRLYYFKEPIV